MIVFLVSLGVMGIIGGSIGLYYAKREHDANTGGMRQPKLPLRRLN
jgi:hypothetical protein